MVGQGMGRCEMRPHPLHARFAEALHVQYKYKATSDECTGVRWEVQCGTGKREVAVYTWANVTALAWCCFPLLHAPDQLPNAVVHDSLAGRPTGVGRGSAPGTSPTSRQRSRW